MIVKIVKLEIFKLSDEIVLIDFKDAFDRMPETLLEQPMKSLVIKLISRNSKFQVKFPVKIRLEKWGSDQKLSQR